MVCDCEIGAVGNSRVRDRNQASQEQIVLYGMSSLSVYPGPWRFYFWYRFWLFYQSPLPARILLRMIVAARF